MDDSPIGRRIGHFRVTDTLGRGGMGVVYRAEDVFLGRIVALKVIRPELAADEDVTRRFMREARHAASLAHPNIATVHEVGRDGALLYLAMELVEGPGLLSLMQAGPLPIGATLAVADDVAAALGAIHARGLVHRDVKPANVRIDEAGRAKLLDFGVAKSIDRRAAPETLLTVPGQLVGSPSFMAPEQARGEPVDARADVFAFGVVLFGMLTGTHPFRRSSRNATIIAIVAEPAPPLPPHLSALAPLVDACLAKRPEDRPPNGAAIAARLRAITIDRVRSFGPTPPAPAEDPATELDASHDVETGPSEPQLFGRAAELAEIDAAFTRAKVVALVGPEGAGKTQLAREHERRRWRTSVRVGPLHDRSLARELASALDLRSAEPEAVGDALAARGTGLVLVDGAEALRGDELARIAARTSATEWLLTSRVPLAITSGAPLRDGIPTPTDGGRGRPTVTPLRSSFAHESVHVGPLDVASGADLLLARMTRSGASGERRLAEELSRALGGNAAALEWAGALAAERGLALVHADLTRETAVPLSAHALAQRSWDEMPEPMRRPLARLSLAASFDLEEARALIGDPSADLEALEERGGLEELEPGRWRVDRWLSTLAEHALEPSEAAAARARWGELLIARAARSIELTKEGLDALGAALLAFASSDEGVLGTRALAAAARLADRGRRDPALLEVLKTAPDRAGIGAVLRAELLLWRARMRPAGERQAGLADLEEAISLATLCRNRPIAAHARYARVGLHLEAGELDHAEREAREAVVEAEHASDDEALQYALNGFAAACWRRGELARAEPALARACDLALARGDRRALARLKLTEGLVASDLGRPERALECYRGSRQASAATSQTGMIPTILHNMGVALHRLGRLDEAEGHLAQAIVLAREEGAEQRSALSLAQLGHLALERGEHEQAERAYDAAAALFEPHAPDLACVLAARALLNAALGRHDRAEADARRARAMATTKPAADAVAIWLAPHAPLGPRPLGEDADIAHRVVSRLR